MTTPNQTGAGNAHRIGPNPFSQTFFHGTKAELETGDEVRPGFESNFTDRKLNHVYVSATLNAAIWGAELAHGEGRQRIYLVEALGEIEDDPNVTDKKFPGNPTMSYRSRQPFRVVGEVASWTGHTEEQLLGMRAHLKNQAAQGEDQIID